VSLSIYNEVAQNEKIKFASSTNGENEIFFEIDLTFTGWRTIWVPYYEMLGTAPKKTAAIDINTFTVSTAAKKGKLFFDDIVFSQYQDDRHSYPDMIVPFIKSDKKSGADHWMPLIQNIEYINNVTKISISEAKKKDLLKIEARLDKSMTLDKKYKVYMESMKKRFDKLGLSYNGKTVVGPPMDYKTKQVFFDIAQQGKDNHNKIDALGKTLKKLANFHDRATPADQKEIERMFVLGTRYYLDQGWQSGSSGGTRHHIGYSVRELAEGFFIMRNTLKKEGLLDEVGASLHWLFNLGMVLGDENKFHVNIDYLNTQAYYHLMLLFLVESPEKQAILLNNYSNYIGIVLSQQDQEWGFKVDGTSWHHNGHYPAYGMGALEMFQRLFKRFQVLVFA
jgi:chondroitin-sulfate-ABC endolyase/exolyase